MIKLYELAERKQGVWLDYILRSFIIEGDLQIFIDEGVRGVTSKPGRFPAACCRVFFNHGQVALSVSKDMEGARTRLAKLAELDVRLESITRNLLDDGVAAFASAFENLMNSLDEKRKRLSAFSQVRA